MPTLDVVPAPFPIRRALAAAIAACSLAGALHLADAPSAAAQATCGNTDATPSLTVDPVSVSASSVSTISVTGRDYLVPPHTCGANVFGGVYVFFGWVAPGDRWGPSWRGDGSNGQFGFTYSYPGDGGGETRDDGSGLVRLISFTDGGTSGAETPFHMDGGGNFSTTLTVRGSLYSWIDSSTGASSTVDCRQVQCGVFTVGAHGKSSRTNERFTPLTFRNDGSPPTVAPGGISSGSSPGTAAPRSTTPNATTPSATRNAGTSGAATNGSTTAPASSTGADQSATTPTSDSATSNSAATDSGTVAGKSAGDEIAAATEGSDDAAMGTERRIVAGKVVAMTDFDSSGGSGGLPLLLVVAAATAAAIAGMWWTRRNRGGATAAGLATNTAAGTAPTNTAAGAATTNTAAGAAPTNTASGETELDR